MMILWGLFAIMTAALIWAVLWPFLRPSNDHVAAREGAQSSVYKSQLAEIDADVERGAISADDAADLRAEVARRLLGQTDVKTESHDTISSASDGIGSRGVVAAIVAAVPLISVTGYLLLGSPFLPSQPHATRVHQDANGVRVAELVRRVEARLAARPDDGRGWDVIAPVYMRLNRYGDAAEAWRNAGRLLGESPERVLGFAEATVFAENGVVSENARRALLRGVELQPDYLPAHFWLAMAKQQDGDLKAARAALAALLPRAGEATPLGRTISDHLHDIDVKLRGATSDVGPIANVDADTAEMIEGMVSGLAARLEDDASDLEGWKRLIRSYVVLKQSGKATAALERARQTFAGQDAAMASLKELAMELKLES